MKIITLVFFSLFSFFSSSQQDTVSFEIMSEDLIAISHALEIKKEDPGFDFLSFSRSLGEREEYRDLIFFLTDDPNGKFEFMNAEGEYSSISNASDATISVTRCVPGQKAKIAFVEREKIEKNNSLVELVF